MPPESLPPPPPASLRRRFGRLTLLNIAANLTVPLASLVDTALLGHLPDVRFLAGVALATILFEYLYWSFGFLRMGTTGLTAQAVGRGDDGESHRVLYRSLTLAGLVGGAILLAHQPLRELGFLLLEGTPEVEAAGREYFNGRVWAAPVTLANFVFLGWYLGREESGRALAMTIAGNVVNVVASYLLIARYGLGALGAGLGTALGQCAMLAAALALFAARGRRTRWSWQEVLRPGRLAELFRLNRDILLRTVALVTAFALFTNFSSVLGTVTLAANTVLLRYLMLAAYLIDGAAFATESLAGTFRGAGDEAALARLRRLALATGLLFALPFAVLLLIFPGPAVRLLTSQPATVEMALGYAFWLAPTLLLSSAAYVYDGLFLGLTAGRTLRNAMLASTLGFFLPLALVALRWESNHLLWTALAAFMLARTVALAWASRALFGAAPT